ncbi:NeuD/PglB/VioB family sugar acetyltransferase [Microbacterium sp. 179-I 3D2 NHS]|uniref:NeuD/PglB/VioB family sugar acetyltransferase n=1 Tax=Microbacterium sp. 179-I 3D2 NHS TaxID=3235178 RepID=UPI00399FC901
MPEALIVVGAGGFGRETLDVIEAINAVSPSPIWTVTGVVDDAPSGADLARLAARGYAHLGAIDDNRERFAAARHVVAIGSPATRARVVARLDDGRTADALVHPRAVVGSQARLSHGVVVCSGAQISTNVTLGAHVHVNPGAIIGHDATLGSFVSVNPGAVISGAVEVGEGSLVGAAAVVLQGLRVGRAATVGAAACVTRDVEPGVVVKGVPAR